MKRIIYTIGTALILCVGRVFAVDPYPILQWELDDPVITEVDGFSTITIDGLVSEGQSIDTVRIKIVDSSGNSTYLKLGNESEEISYADGWGIPDAEGSWTAGPMYAELGRIDADDPALYFVMELGTYSNDQWLVAAAGYESYASVASAGHIIKNELSYQGSSPWTGGTWVVPEPSIAMLVLLGTCCLLLKRRNMNSSVV